MYLGCGQWARRQRDQPLGESLSFDGNQAVCDDDVGWLIWLKCSSVDLGQDVAAHAHAWCHVVDVASIDRCCGGALGITDVAIENVWAVDHQRFNGDETGGSDDHMADSTEVFSADFVDDSSRR
jgi:hypothetical protein